MAAAAAAAAAAMLPGSCSEGAAVEVDDEEEEEEEEEGGASRVGPGEARRTELVAAEVALAVVGWELEKRLLEELLLLLLLLLLLGEAAEAEAWLDAGEEWLVSMVRGPLSEIGADAAHREGGRESQHTQKGYHMKGHLKRNRMMQISAA